VRKNPLDLGAASVGEVNGNRATILILARAADMALFFEVIDDMSDVAGGF